jgi:hypothetical protein
MDETICVHCERRLAAGPLGLCPVCGAVRGIRRLYVRHRGWTPAWERHLRALTARASLRLPLFPDASPTLPPPSKPEALARTAVFLAGAAGFEDDSPLAISR